MPNAVSALSKSNPYSNLQSSWNPFTGSEGVYKTSPWQAFLSSIGIRTQADAWNENMQVQSQEYAAALAQKAYDEQYNLPINQVARLRAAGINPDLNGGDSIDSGSAQPMGEDPSTPMQSTGDEGMIMSVANGCLTAFSTALGLVQSVQGIQRNHLQNIMQSISNESAFSEFTKGLWPMFLPESPNPAAGDGESLMSNAFDWKSAALSNAKKFAGNLPQKMQDKFVSQVEQYWSSGPGQAESYKDWSDRVKSRRNFYRENGTFYSDIDDVLEDIVKPLNEMTEKIYKSAQNSDLAVVEATQAKAENEQEYYSTLDAAQQANAENAENKLADTNATTANILNESIESIVKNLENSQKEGGLKGALSGIALALIAGVRLWLVNVGAPSISRSSSQSSSDSYGKTISHSGSHSEGFSIGF